MVEGLGELDVDRGADSARSQRYIRRFQHIDLAYEIGVDRTEIERAVEINVARGVAHGAGNLPVIKKCDVERRTETADRDRGAFTGRRYAARARRGADTAGDGHARNAHHRIRQIDIREFADVLAGDRIDETGRVALDVEIALQRGPEARHDNGFDTALAVTGSLLRSNGCGSDAHRDRRGPAQQNRMH